MSASFGRHSECSCLYFGNLSLLYCCWFVPCKQMFQNKTQTGVDFWIALGRGVQVCCFLWAKRGQDVSECLWLGTSMNYTAHRTNENKQAVNSTPNEIKKTRAHRKSSLNGKGGQLQKKRKVSILHSRLRNVKTIYNSSIKKRTKKRFSCHFEKVCGKVSNMNMMRKSNEHFLFWNGYFLKLFRMGKGWLIEFRTFWVKKSHD